LDVHQVSEVIEGGTKLDEVLAVRREWWLSVTHLGMEPAGDADRPPSSFAEPEDSDATHVMLRRYDAKGNRLAASLRLRRGPEENSWQLDTLAFRPEDTGDETEILLLRTTLQEARRRGADEVRIAAPRLRREIYEEVGFASVPERIAKTVDSSTHQLMIWSPSPTEHDSTFDVKYDAEQRLCGCSQTGCPARDYTAPKRSYYCPLDVREGRIPEGYPVGKTS
jgi:predicted GNAT family N-acyltransferase